LTPPGLSRYCPPRRGEASTATGITLVSRGIAPLARYPSSAKMPRPSNARSQENRLHDVNPRSPVDPISAYPLPKSVVRFAPHPLTTDPQTPTCDPFVHPLTTPPSAISHLPSPPPYAILKMITPYVTNRILAHTETLIVPLPNHGNDQTQNDQIQTSRPNVKPPNSKVFPKRDQSPLQKTTKRPSGSTGSQLTANLARMASVQLTTDN